MPVMVAGNEVNPVFPVAGTTSGAVRNPLLAVQAKGWALRRDSGTTNTPSKSNRNTVCSGLLRKLNRSILLPQTEEPLGAAGGHILRIVLTEAVAAPRS